MGIFKNLFSKKTSRKIDIVTLNRDLEIVNDCAKLIESTVNPEIFFTRYDLYLEKLSVLAAAQKSNIIKVQGDNLIQKYYEMSTPEKRVSATNEFINRFWNATCKKADSLKTEKGKQNKFQDFFDTLSKYDCKMPEECIEYYSYIFSNAQRNTKINRKAIAPEKIDSMQQIEASKTYRDKICALFYKGYPEPPFISMDRELNTNWIEQANYFGVTPAREMMVRYSDGLLPGHIYMLYWIKNVHRERIPAYFEYRYGVNFYKEKIFLTENGYLKDDKPTEKGERAISKHYKIIEEQHPTPKYTGEQSDISLIQVPPARSFSDKLTEEKVLIPEQDRKVIAKEINYINKLIAQASELAHIKKRLQINEKNFLYEIGYTYYTYTPFTPTKRLSKSPLTLYYAYTSHKETAPKQDYWGNISFFRDGTIGSARLIFWDCGDGYIINLGIINGILSVKKVEYSAESNWMPLYKA